MPPLATRAISFRPASVQSTNSPEKSKAPAHGVSFRGRGSGSWFKAAQNASSNSRTEMLRRPAHTLGERPSKIRKQSSPARAAAAEGGGETQREAVGPPREHLRNSFVAKTRTLLPRSEDSDIPSCPDGRWSKGIVPLNPALDHLIGDPQAELLSSEMLDGGGSANSLDEPGE